MIIEILGCGGSRGVPEISNGYNNCDAKNKKNNRYRTSCLIHTNDNTRILIDTPPEIRLQVLRAGVEDIDALFLTHAHYDHIAGLPDVASFYFKTGKKIPLYLNARTLKGIAVCFCYLISESGESECFDVHIIQENQPFFIKNTKITPILGYHSKVDTICYIIDNMAYCTDFHTMSEIGEGFLQNIDTLILGVSRMTGYTGYHHLALKDALRLIEKWQPNRTFFTHMGNQLDYETLCTQLPNNIRPSYDGLKIKC